MLDLRPSACLINGQWLSCDTMRPVLNPANGRCVGQVPEMGYADAMSAIDAAHAALPDWSARTASQRSAILKRFHALILADADRLADLLTAEQGKPLTEAKAEILYAASFIEWFAEETKRAYGEVIPATRSDHRIFTIRQPVGVVAAITPWNFPAAMVTRKIGPALAAGCTVILKPAEQTPLSALALGVLAQHAGLPAGVLNIVTGDAREIGRALTQSPVVRKLSFTGSTQTGSLLYAQCATSIKKLSLELGGNAPFLVFDDTNVDEAVAGAIASKFRNAGQTCVCTNRFYVQSGIHDAFVGALAKATAALKVGRGDDPESEIGPLIDASAIAKVKSHIEDALTHGAVLACGGEPHSAGEYFFTPTVLSGVTSDMLICREETFGPVAPVVRFETEAEAIAMANATPFGLAGYLYTNDIRRIWRVSEALEVGMLGVNTGMISTEVAPFGGIKSSGLGREGSRHGLDDYLEIKTITLAV